MSDTALAKRVFERNSSTINADISKTIYSYKLNKDFRYRAYNIFYGNFDEKYEDDSSYLSYFRVAMINTAKNVYRKRKINAKFVSSFLNAEGEEVDIYDVIVHDAHCGYSDDVNVFLTDLEKWLFSELDEDEQMLYELLVENNWTLKDMAYVMDVNTRDIKMMRENIQEKVKYFYNLENIPLTIGV